MKQVPILTIPDGAKDAVATAKPTMPVHPKVRRAAQDTVRYTAFGARMKPTFKQQLLHYSSFRALRLVRYV